MARKSKPKEAADAETLEPEDFDGPSDLKPIDALRNFRRAFEAKERFLEAADEDILFALGHQWDETDIRTLQKAGVRPLTINQIAPILRLMKGIESQNRSELRAYPEGGEDGLTAEIVSRLIKSANKTSDLDYKFSELFENGNGVGRSTLEPYLEYDYKADAEGAVDMLARLCVKVRHHNTIFEDPASVEYDMSDGEYVCKFTPDLHKRQLLNLFPNLDPETRKDIIAAKSGKITIDAISLEIDGTGIEVQRKGYPREDTAARGSWITKSGFDLLDYYYKHWNERWFVVDAHQGKTIEMKTEEEAKSYVAKATANEPDGQKSAKIFSKYSAEIWVAFLTGGIDDFLYNGPAWSAPAFKGYPLFDYYAYRSTYHSIDVNHRDLLVQGITRGAKDSNRELNKRRTQELRHLNQSSNSGWIVSDESLTPKQEQHLKNFGGTAGVVVKYVNGKPIPVKIEPAALSQGHAQMAQEHRQDMRDTVGLNTETLSVESDQSSGRAIAQRIKQGMVQVQGLFDNYARTRRNFGRFLIQILSKLFDVDKVKHVLGEAFLQDNFSQPVMKPVMGPTGQPMMDPATGQPAMAPQMQYDDALATQVITKVLQDTEIGVYDVAVGEIVAAATTMYGQFQEALELRNQGIPIPPDVLINRSSLPESDKKKTISALQAAAANPTPAPKSKQAA